MRTSAEGGVGALEAQPPKEAAVKVSSPTMA